MDNPYIERYHRVKDTDYMFIVERPLVESDLLVKLVTEPTVRIDRNYMEGVCEFTVDFDKHAHELFNMLHLSRNNIKPFEVSINDDNQLYVRIVKGTKIRSNLRLQTTERHKDECIEGLNADIQSYIDKILHSVNYAVKCEARRQRQTYVRVWTRTLDEVAGYDLKDNWEYKMTEEVVANAKRAYDEAVDMLNDVTKKLAIEQINKESDDTIPSFMKSVMTDMIQKGDMLSKSKDGPFGNKFRDVSVSAYDTVCAKLGISE